MLNSYKILVVDDEPDITEFVCYNLKKEGFQVCNTNNGKSAVELVDTFQPHLILLDIMMPDMDGIETCEKIREKPENREVVIAFLTARSEDYSQIAGFEAGADDYISKPIRPKVLISRINALLKRYGHLTDIVLQQNKLNTVGDIVIDSEKFVVLQKGVPLYLPRKEFYLLQLLASKPMKVFTREEIFDHIWGSEIFVGDRTIDVYIRKLREKLGDVYIKTIKGVGYKFDPN